MIAVNLEHALAYFQEAANANPEYIYESGLFRQSIWTYLGRTQYQPGMLKEAAQSCERALAVNPDDCLARIYLGLVEARTGDRSVALKHIQSGMRGLYEWLEYVERSWPQQAFWDPRVKSALPLKKPWP